MPSPSTRRQTCRLCESANVAMALPMAATPVADDYVTEARLGEAQPLVPLDLYQCGDCGHVQLLDVVNPDVLFRDYTYRTSVSLGLLRHFELYAASLVGSLELTSGALAVDIGSNDGTILRFLQERGLRVLGIDPAVEIAEAATASGVETLPMFFTSDLASDIKRQHGVASLITANNMFAHADDLGDIAEGVRELLADDGVFVFEVSSLADIIDRDLFDTVYHEHLCYHSVGPLVSFLDSHGLQLFDVQEIATKGGSMRVFAQLANGPRPVEPSVSAYLAKEARLGLDGPEPLRAMGERLQQRKAELHELLGQLKADGRVIAGYGASTTVTTLIYYFDLGRYLDFLADDNPLKVGTYSPGHHLPVLSGDAIYDRGATDVLVLAWAYADPIVKKHQKFRDAGGHFIIPMPRVEVL